MRKSILALTGLFLLFGTIQSQVYTITKSWSGTPVTVDGCGSFCVALPSLTVLATDVIAGSVVDDVDVTITWQKTDGTCASPGTGNSFHNETSFQINSPGGNVILASPGTWSGADDIPPVTTYFNQGSPVPGGIPVDGDFGPNGGDLSTLNGAWTTAIGNWTLFAGDNAGGDPLCITAYSVNITLSYTDPTITCPTVASVNNDAGQCGALVNYSLPLGSDNCALAGNSSISLSSGWGSGSLFPVGSNTDAYTLTNDCGGEISCNVNIVVEDNEPPVGNCQNLTVALDGSGNASITADQVAGGSTDNCEILSKSVNPGFFDCTDVGPNPVSVTVNDIHGNSSSCSSSVEIVDNIPPTLTCQNVTVQLNASGTGQSNPFLNGALISQSDNCGVVGGVGVTGPNPYTCAHLGTFPVTIIQDDQSGNEGTCTVDITVVDGTAPTVVCQNITVQLNASGSVTVTPAQIDGGSTDNCGVDDLTILEGGDAGLVLGCVNLGSNTATLQASDASGNSNTCTATVTVQDNVAPTVVCQNVTVQLNAAGNGTTTATAVNGGSSDACGIASISAAPLTFTCSNVGANTVTLAVTDANGNASTCTANAEVEDNVAPNAVCQDVTVQLNAAGNGSTTAGAVNNGSSDACGIASLSVSPSSFSCGNVGSNTVTLTVTDANGNASNCTANAEVEDNVAPNAVCQNVTVQLNAAGNGTTTATAVNGGSSDACGIASISVAPSAFTCINVGANAVTLTVTDVNGNASTCTANAEVEDNVAPNAVCQNVTVQLNAAGNGSTTAGAVDNGSNDVCGIAGLSIDNTDFTCADVGGNTVVLTVSDNNGNASTCGATITVEENIDPVIVGGCPANISVSNSALNCNQLVGWSHPLTTDNCGISTTVFTSPGVVILDYGIIGVSGLFSVGTSTVTYTVTDDNSNVVNCTFSITVTDDENPTITGCPANINIGTDDGICGAQAFWTTPTASDNCPGVVLADNGHFSGQTYPVGSTTVEYIATDNVGLQAVCTFNINVSDDEDPEITCPANVNVDTDLGSCSASGVALGDPITDDNCNVASVGNDAVEPFVLGSTTVNWTVTDDAGNTSTCTHKITVTDNEAPSAICQDVTVSLDNSGNGSTTATAVDNGSNDACGIAGIAIDITSFECADVGDNTVTLTATDANGNTSTCTASVEVEDNVPPVANCQDLTVQLDGNGIAGVEPDEIDNTSTDACGIQNLSLDNTSFDCSDLGGTGLEPSVWINEFHYDNTGGDADEFVEVAGTAGYDLSGHSIVLYNGSNGESYNTTSLSGSIDDEGDGFGAVAEFISGIQNGGPDGLALVDASGAVIEFLSYEGTMTATDGPANGMTSADVGVSEASSAPLNTSLQKTGAGSSSVDFAWSPTSAASPGTVNAGQTFVTPAGLSVTLTVTDNNGNSSTCTSAITLEDNVPPVALCQDLTVQLDGNGIAGIEPDEIDNASTDACGIAELSLDISEFDCSDLDMDDAPQVWINEFHYDNDGADVGEFIEIAGLAGADLTGHSVVLYNGSNGTIYNSLVFVSYDVIDAGIGYLVWGLSGIQNGSPDGIALVGPSGVLEFISYEGSFTATNGPAVGMTSTDIGVSEPGSTPAGQSLQRTGGAGSSFAGPLANTAGGLNTGQVIPSGGGVNVTLTATDINGNSSTCSANIKVEDNIAPNAQCANITVQLNDAGTTSITVDDIDNGSSDNCLVEDRTIDTEVFGCSDVGSVQVVLTVTDQSGNSGSCTSNVTVQDNVPPIAICQDLTIQLDGSGNAAITPAQVNNSSTDACGVQSIDLDDTQFDCSDIGALPTPYVWINEFHYDNDGSDQGEFFEVAGFAGTDLSGYSIVLYNGNGGSQYGSVALTGVLSDEGAGAGTLSVPFAGIQNGSPDGLALIGPSGVLEFISYEGSLTASDGPAAGMTSADIVVEEPGNTPVGQSLQRLGGAGSAFTGPATASPGAVNSGQVVATSAGVPVVLTVTDNNGNASQCEASITVGDLIIPDLVCPGDIEVDTDPGLCSAVIDGSLTNPVEASDNCSSTLEYFLSGNPYGLFSTYAGSGTGPIGTTTITGGSAEITYTLTDASSNSISCSFTITVNDNEPPVVTCPDDISVDTDPDQCSAVVDYEVGLSENCPIFNFPPVNAPSLTDGLSSGAAFPIGVTVNNYSFTDVQGNSSSCSFTVTVTDNQLPDVVCQDVTITLDDDGTAEFSTTVFNNGSSDNCELNFPDNTISAGCANVGTIGLNLVVSDGAGNTSVCTPSLTVQDNTPPVAICQDLTIQLDTKGEGAITAEQVNDNSTDACGIDEISVSIEDFTCSNVGTNTVTLTVTDVNGNSSICTSSITVEDDIPPTASCKDITVTLDASGNYAITAGDVDDESDDNCDIGSLAVSPSAFTCEEAGDNTVTLIATDVNGNSASCEANVHVIGFFPDGSISADVLPVLCQGGTIILTANSDIPVQSYLWSTGETSQSIQVNSNDTYTVDVKSLTGCITTFSYEVDDYVAGTLLSSYTILATDGDVHLHDNNTVSNGGVGVIDPDKKAKLHDETVVNSFVQAPEVDITGGSSAASVILEPADVILPPFYTNPFSNNDSPDVKVEDGEVVTLTDCVFDKVDIKKNATVTFTCDNIFITELKTSDNVTIIFAGSANVFVDKKVKIDKNNTFNPTGETVTVYVDDHFEVKEGSDVHANVYAAKDIKVDGKDDNPTSMTGLFIGKKVDGKDHVNWNWDTNCDPAPIIIPSIRVTDNSADPDANEALIDGMTGTHAYPNPFTREVMIDFTLKESARTTLVIFSLSGEAIESIDLGLLEKGMLHQHQFTPDNNLPAGTYLYRIVSGKQVATGKLIYMK